MTFTVSRTTAPTWPGEGRQAVLVVAGDLTGWAWPKLAEILAETEDDGVERIVLDIRAVSSCDREALFELVKVRGRWPSRQSCVVDVVGVRRVQFLDVLAQEPLRHLPDLQMVIGELCRPSVPPPIGDHAAPSPRRGDDGDPPLGAQIEPGISHGDARPRGRLLLDQLPSIL